MQTFGWNLLQFARSVDIVHQEVVDGMKELVTEYFMSKRGLDACYFCVHRPGGSVRGTSLEREEETFKTVWTSGPVQDVKRFKEPDTKESPNLRAFAYNEGRPLWVTVEEEADSSEKAENGEDQGTATATLKDPAGGKLVDQWSESPQHDKELPSYVSLHDKPCRTLIALPLTHLQQKIGVLVLEFRRRIPCSPAAREEAELIRSALARILWLQDAVIAQIEGTRKALEELRVVVANSTSAVDPPTVFFAFSSQADKTVTDTAKKVFRGKFSNVLRLVPWDEMSGTGQITDEIIAAIANCRYGICYLSEDKTETESDPGETTAGDLDGRYNDNPNVLIEAGMLQALGRSRGAMTQAWVGIRETEDRTGRMPFDFSVERMIEVERDEEGQVKVENFADALEKQIQTLLEH